MPSVCARKLPLASGFGLCPISGAHPELKFGFSNEFIGSLPTAGPACGSATASRNETFEGSITTSLSCSREGEIQATDLYSTDAEIRAYNLRVLRDDLAFFPSYECVWLYRADLPERCPAAFAAISALAGRISVSDIGRHERPGQARSCLRRSGRGRLPRGEARGSVRGQSRKPISGDFSVDSASTSHWCRFRSRQRSSWPFRSAHRGRDGPALGRSF